MNLSILIDSTVFSYSQIFFSNRRWFGFLVLCATFINPINGSIILFSTLITNLIALILNFDEKKVREGFYGFNGLLFGAALSFFYKPNEYFIPILILFLLINFFIITSIENYFAFAFNLPGLSLPFLLSFYLFILFNREMNLFESNSIVFTVSQSLDLLPSWLNSFLINLGLIILQPHWVSGLIIFLSILLFSRIMTVLILLGYLVSIILMNIFSITSASTHGILISINAILVSIALGGSLVIPSNRSIILSFFSTLIVFVFTIVLFRVLKNVNLNVFVLPFNFTVFLVVYSLKFRSKSDKLVLLYFKPGSPEENYYYHINQRSRFEKYKFMNARLPFNGEWTVSQAFDGEFTHKAEWRYAFDFVITDEENKTFKDSGIKLNDFHCYNLPVVAVYKGKVVKVVDGVEENEIGKINIKQNWGNTVIIDHGQGLFSAVSHLKKDSVKVKEGDEVEKGGIIGLCGNSGRSPEPHIHFQFQKNDKVGSSTIQFPFGHFLVNKNNRYELKSYDYPAQDDKIQPLEIDSKIKDAFMFEFGDKYEVEFQYGEKSLKEVWEVKIDPFNIPYIESSSGSIATFFNDDEVFYFTSYIGKRKDALYHFYMAAIRIPFITSRNIYWFDIYPVSMLSTIFVRLISDIFILLTDVFHSRGEYKFDFNEAGEYVFTNRIKLEGNGIFNLLQIKRYYELIISKDGKLKSLVMYENGDNKLRILWKNGNDSDLSQVK